MLSRHASSFKFQLLYRLCATGSRMDLQVEKDKIISDEPDLSRHTLLHHNQIS